MIFINVQRLSMWTSLRAAARSSLSCCRSLSPRHRKEITIYTHLSIFRMAFGWEWTRRGAMHRRCHRLWTVATVLFSVAQNYIHCASIVRFLRAASALLGPAERWGHARGCRVHSIRAEPNGAERNGNYSNSVINFEASACTAARTKRTKNK